MSYDVAVWEGDMPTDDEQALDVYASLAERYELTIEPPSPRILAYISALTARYPDLTDSSVNQLDDSPWAGVPLVADALGPLLSLTLVYNKAEEVLPFISETARSHGLVCFDPQLGSLI